LSAADGYCYRMHLEAYTFGLILEAVTSHLVKDAGEKQHYVMLNILKKSKVWITGTVSLEVESFSCCQGERGNSAIMMKYHDWNFLGFPKNFSQSSLGIYFLLGQSDG